MLTQRYELIIRFVIKGGQTIILHFGARFALVPDLLGPPHHHAQHDTIVRRFVSFVSERQWFVIGHGYIAGC